ncbi:MAG TPA: hypothetical protein VH761_15170 [Ilumatobacteraceae bacterium]
MGRSGTGLGWSVAGFGIVIAAIGVALLFDSGDDTAAIRPATSTSAPAITPAPVVTAPATTPAPATIAPTVAATTTVPATTVSATTTLPIAAATTTSTSAPPPNPAAAVEAFFESFSAAIQAGDETFLSSHLSPLVLERYDGAACDAQLADLQIPQGSVEYVEIVEVGAWDWTTDDITRTIEAVTTVKTRTTSDGTTFDDTESHVIVDDNGFVYWFTDCGSPKGGAL